MSENAKYVCTRVIKERTKDVYDGGLDEETITDFDVIDDASSSNLADLFVTLGQAHGFDINEVSIPFTDDGLNTFDYVTFVRQENENGEPPTEEETATWKRGESLQYEACYRFFIVKRVEGRLPLEDIVASGINVDK